MSIRHPYRLEWRTGGDDGPISLWRGLAGPSDLQRAALDLMRSGAVLDAEFRIGTPDHRPGSHHSTSGRAIAAWRPERDALPTAVPTSTWDRDEAAVGKGSEVVERVRKAVKDAVGHGLMERADAAKAVRSVSDMLDEDGKGWG